MIFKIITNCVIVCQEENQHDPDATVDDLHAQPETIQDNWDLVHCEFRVFSA